MMKKILILSLGLVLQYNVWAQPAQNNNSKANTFLTIKNGGHTAVIRQMAVTNDGKTIITAGDDKVIYLRNSQTGEVIDALYGHIGEGSEGKIFAMALSPDNKYLAVVGYFSFRNDLSSGKMGAVRIYDFPSRKMVALLYEGPTEEGNAVAFSDDSKYLVVGAGTSLKVWSMDNMKLYRTFTQEHGLPILSVAFKNKQIVSAASDEKVVLWNMENDKCVKVDSTHKIERNYVAISPDGKTIASVGFDGKLVIYNNNLNVLQVIDNGVLATDIAFTPDSKNMLLGADGDKMDCNLYEFNVGKWAKIATYKGFKFSVLATAFIDNNTAACAGGDNNELAIWKWQKDLKTKAVTITEINRFSGKGKPIVGVGLKDKQVFYTNASDTDFTHTSLTQVFDLYSKKNAAISVLPENVCRAVLQQGDYSLKSMTFREPGHFGTLMQNNALSLMRRGVSVRKIYKTGPEGYQHTCYTFTKDDNIISGGTTGLIMAYNKEGKMLSRLVGHKGTVADIALSADGKILVSCAIDQTIKFWDLAEIGQKANEMPSPAEFADPMFLKYYEKRNLVKQSNERSFAAWQEIIRDMRSLQFNDYADYFQKCYDLLSAGEVKPIASLYVGTDNEWILWSEDGYFTSSKYGGKYIGYHVNQGYDKDAKFYPFEQFDLQYNRPDIMLRRIGIDDPALASAYFNAYKKRLSRLGFSAENMATDVHLPEIVLQSRSAEVVSRFTDVEFDAKDELYNLDRINIFINDIPIYGIKGISLKGQNLKAVHQKLKVELTKGKNKIQVSALNEKGVESLKETYYVTCSDPASRIKNRYVVLIGVSDYENNDYDLKYAAKDATDFAKQLTVSKSAFAATKTLVINDKEATRENIIKARQFFLQSNVDDQAILFVAGHGLLDNELNWYFATTDVDFANPAARGLEYSQLEGLLDSIPARNKILFMDACHSGEVDKEETQQVTVNSANATNVNARGFKSYSNKANALGLKSSFELMQELFTDLSKGSGAVVISSASGAEYAYESPEWNNGVFTYSLIEGLRANVADKNKDGKVKVSELRDYISNRVAQLTNGRQTPTMRKENLEFDFDF